MAVISRVRSLVLFTVILTTGLTNVDAQTASVGDEGPNVDFAGLDIQASAGWDGYVDDSAPVSFSFLISNNSDQVIEGTLILEDPLNGRKIELGEIFVGPNSVRQFQSIQAMSNWYQCVASLSGRNKTYWRRELPLHTGKDFSAEINYLLFVDDSGRSLQLPVDETVSNSSGRFLPQLGKGNPVQPLSAKTWQIPRHPGPLTVVQAIVFSEQADADRLNDVQWEAIAKWMCLGGTVFVCEKSTEIIDRLKKATPLEMLAPTSFEQLAVYRCGAGSVRAYSGQLFSASDLETPRLLATATSRLTSTNLASMINWAHLSWGENSNSDVTRMLVVTVFAGYWLMSGIITLMIFRQSRRRIAIYTLTVVAGACVAAAVLGGVLRSSYGDLRWASITQAGPGGIVQLGKIDVRSAGGRNTLMAVRGKHADLQLMEGMIRDPYPFYYFGNQTSHDAFPPFRWHENLQPDTSDAYQIRVPVTPWGQRRTYATGYDSEVRPLDVSLKYEPPSAQWAGSGILPGKFTLTVTSHLPFDLAECTLVIGRTDALHTAGKQFTRQGFQPSTQVVGRQSGVQFQRADANERFSNIRSSHTVTQEFTDLRLRYRDNSTWGFSSASGVDIADIRNNARSALPRAIDAWIVGKLAISPVLAIDEEHSDFQPMNESHLFVQEIPAEALPLEWLQFEEERLQQQIDAALKASR